ncbi:hypothetical protein METHPM2_230001 [Pseudomonas sp. PM2]
MVTVCCYSSQSCVDTYGAMRAGQPTYLQTDTPLSQASQLPQWTVVDLKFTNTYKNAPIFRSGHSLFAAF